MALSGTHESWADEDPFARAHGELAPVVALRPLPRPIPELEPTLIAVPACADEVAPSSSALRSLSALDRDRGIDVHTPAAGLHVDHEFWELEDPHSGWSVPIGVMLVMVALGVAAVAGLLAVVSSVSGPDAPVVEARSELPAGFTSAQLQRRSFPPISGVLRSDPSVSVAMRGYLHADGVVCAEVRVGADVVDSLCAPAPSADQIVGSELRRFETGTGETVDGMIRVSGATSPHVVAFTLGDQTEQHPFCPGSPTTVWLERGQSLECLPEGARVVGQVANAS